MIDIQIEARYQSTILDQIARVAVPSTIGVSTGPYGTKVHLPDGTSQANQDKVQSILEQFGALVVNANKTTMTEGDANPVITVATADASLGYVVLLDGEEYASGDESPVGGTVTLNLISPVASVYDIFVYRQIDDFRSGSVSITVSEA